MWKVISATSIGVSHKEVNTPCQDAHCVRKIHKDTEEYIICIVSDGAGSAKFSQVGARYVCRYSSKLITNALKSGTIITKNNIHSAVTSIQQELDYAVTKRGKLLRDYACTFICAILTPSQSVFIQVGDGAIVVSKNKVSGVIFWPDNNMYENMTYFFTDKNVLNHLKITCTNMQFDEVSLFSDGIQRLALDYQKQLPHSPFFTPMFDVLSKSVENPSKLSMHLTKFLDSDGVNTRTDDDKSLILATRHDTLVS